MIKYQTTRPGHFTNKLIPVLWGAFATLAVAAMIGLAPVGRGSVGSPAAGAQLGLGGAGWTDERCNQCHEIDPVFSHPVGFRPGRPLPEKFPLQGGRLTCQTCHDGDSAATHSRARDSHDPMLRSAFEGRAFCAECHESSPMSSGMGHAGAVGAAHPARKADRRERSGGSFAGGLDPESASCLECHDGMTAMAAGGGHGGGLGGGRGLNNEHPIGVPYQSGRGARGMARMVNAASLDKRIRLFNGNIGCGSCHSVYSPIDHKLVMSNLRSALCLSCHDG
ncbi:MAG: hypothetical protein H6810_01030 [Phycisphaeraceae bacterium]|nr:MAG: hypothetical protein H6810_01030 [Phycisphaeraceae bacterium]